MGARRYAPAVQARHRTLLGIASLLAHAGVLAILAALPSAERARTLDAGDPIVVVEWSGDGADPAAQHGTRMPTDAGHGALPTTPVTKTDGEPPQDRASALAPRRAPARARSSAVAPTSAEPAPQPETNTAASASDGDTAGDVAAPNALALQGLREHSSARAHVPSPRASPSIGGARAGEHTVPLPEHSPDGPDDRGALPRSLADAGFVRNKKGDYVFKAPGGQYTAILLPDGRIGFDDHLVTASKADGFAPRMAGLPELVRKAQGRELWAHDKAKLARRTFDLRLGIAVAYAEKQIDRRLATLYRDLLEIWGQSAKAPVARRRTIFERWDECDEKMRVKLPGFEHATDTRIDALRASAGEKARDKITSFIRKQLPKGSEHAYGDEELAELNRRRHSKARFAPYDDADTPAD